MISSRQVAYYPVYTLLAPLLGAPGLIPGTPEWCQLDDTDAAKWSAVLWCAVWWCLEQDDRQAATADASREISNAADWSGVSREIRRRSGVRIPREVA